MHKFDEVRRVLAEYGLATVMLKIKTFEVQDDDVENIAKMSALSAFREVNLPVIVEDAGLFIEALNGFPGPYSSYAYRTIGVNGILKLMNGVDNRKAQFKSVVAFCNSINSVKCFHGVSNGRISEKPRGSGGFGFDPIFEPEEKPGRTFAEMSIEEKNMFSHRAKAIRMFAEWYKRQQNL
jgi:XTP/dITP diphosphohydrolase